MNAATGMAPASRSTAPTLVVGMVGGLAILLAAVPGWSTKLLTRVTLDRQSVPPPDLIATLARPALLFAGIALLGVAFLARRRLPTPAGSGAGLRATIRDDVARLRAAPVIVPVTLALLIIGGIVFRSAFLAQPLGYDESITYVYFASRSLLDVLADYAIPNNHIFHTLQVYLVDRLVGPVTWLLRMPAFLAGVLSIPLGGYLGYRLTRRPLAGLLATALLAAAPVMVEFSSQARGYSLLALLFIVAMLAATFVEDRDSRPALAALILTSALGLWTVPTFALGIAAPFAWILLGTDRSRLGSRTATLALAGAASLALAALLYLPVLVVSGWASLVGNDYVAPMSLGTWSREVFARAGATLECWGGGVPVWVGVGVVTVAVLAVIADPVRSRIGRLVLALVVGLLPIVVLLRVAPLPRMVHFLFPAAAVMVAAGLEVVARRVAVRGRHVTVACIVALVVAGGWAASRWQIGDAGWDRSHVVERPAKWGVYGTSCCTEGFFVDGAAIADQFAEELADGALLIAHVWSGVVESTQFTLMQHGLSPVAARPYRYAGGLAQIADAPELLVVIKRDRPAGDEPRGVLDLLRVDSADYAAAFLPPEHVAALVVSDVYRVRRRPGPDGTLPVRQPLIDYPR